MQPDNRNSRLLEIFGAVPSAYIKMYSIFVAYHEERLVGASISGRKRERTCITSESCIQLVYLLRILIFFFSRLMTMQSVTLLYKVRFMASPLHRRRDLTGPK